MSSFMCSSASCTRRMLSHKRPRLTASINSAPLTEPISTGPQSSRLTASVPIVNACRNLRGYLSSSAVNDSSLKRSSSCSRCRVHWTIRPNEARCSSVQSISDSPIAPIACLLSVQKRTYLQPSIISWVGAGSQAQPARNDVSLHLRCSGVDRAADRVAERALDLIFDHEAIAPMQLDRISRGLHQRLAHEQLRDRRIQRDAAAFA